MKIYLIQSSKKISRITFFLAGFARTQNIKIYRIKYKDKSMLLKNSPIPSLIIFDLKNWDSFEAMLHYISDVRRKYPFTHIIILCLPVKYEYYEDSYNHKLKILDFIDYSLSYKDFKKAILSCIDFVYKQEALKK